MENPADLILTGGVVWTGDDALPGAEAVAIRGERIVAVGSDQEVLALAGESTRRIDLAGRFVPPGFIDNHTHFNRAGELLLGVNLLEVVDADGLMAEVREKAERLPPGAWMVGGMWGSYAEWGTNSTGGGSLLVWLDNFMADPLTIPDRTMGSWENVLQATHRVPTAIRPRVSIKSFGTGGAANGPQKHGDFDDHDFWRPEFLAPSTTTQ